MSLVERFKNGWDAFLGRDPTYPEVGYPYGSASRPDRIQINYTNLRSIVTSIYNRIAVDAAQITIQHVRLDDTNKTYKETIDDDLNYALTRRANIDQTGRALIKDVVFSMFDEGCVAIVPTLTIGDPNQTESYQIRELRVGKIVEWFPQHVRVDLYNDHTGRHTQLIFPKSYVAIVENPFYQIMNEQNSTVKRLKRTIAAVDKANSSGNIDKLDLIVQLPYQLRSGAKRAEAARRKKDLEDQLENSKLGIGFIDATEHVIQLNRSVENNLWQQARDLQEDLFNELGFTQTIFDGTADEQTMLNYNNRTIEPVLSAITEAMEMSWLSKTAISQHQGIRFYRDPFKLVPVGQIADIADKFTRNEIMTSNELRGVIGLLPSKDTKADELRNSNLNHPDEKAEVTKTETIEKTNSVDVQSIVDKISK